LILKALPAGRRRSQGKAFKYLPTVGQPLKPGELSPCLESSGLKPYTT
jgi:hypothetical protein